MSLVRVKVHPLVCVCVCVCVFVSVAPAATRDCVICLLPRPRHTVVEVNRIISPRWQFSSTAVNPTVHYERDEAFTQVAHTAKESFGMREHSGEHRISSRHRPRAKDDREVDRDERSESTIRVSTL